MFCKQYNLPIWVARHFVLGVQIPKMFALEWLIIMGVRMHLHLPSPGIWYLWNFKYQTANLEILSVNMSFARSTIWFAHPRKLFRGRSFLKLLTEWKHKNSFKSRYIDVQVGHYLLFMFSPPKISLTVNGISIWIHVLIVYYLTQPSSKQNICIDFKKTR